MIKFTKEPSRSKTRSLVMILCCVLPSRSDLPVTFESLNDDTLGLIQKFVGNNSYKSFGGLNKRCKEIYITSGMTKETFLFGYAPLSVIQDRIEKATRKRFNWKLFYSVGKGVVYFNRSDVLEWALEGKDTFLLRRICIVAAEEERLDILNEVWNDIDDMDDKRYVFGEVDVSAARGGKLDVMKWLGTKGLSIDEKECALQAARNGQPHILKWLQEEQGLKLYGELYNDAIIGGCHLHVMRWLREKEVPWDEYTFRCAANKRNLDVIQWLHDEGCPCSDDDYNLKQ